MDIDKELLKIKDEIIACQKCSLCKERKNPVIGEGSHTAKIIFVGEAPGAKEDETGVPFCGRSGKFLSELLSSVGIEREDVYICNIIKCRPPKNRDPKDSEINACKNYLERQIELINPKIICSLGRYSMDFMMNNLGLSDSIQPIGKIHGQVFKKKRTFIPFYHPAVAIYNSKMKESLKKDFEILKKYVD